MSAPHRNRLRERPREPGDDDPQQLPGEVLLVGAIVRQAVLDARRTHALADAKAERKRQRDQAQARAFLAGSEDLHYWCALVGAESRQVQARLRQVIEGAHARGATWAL